jgi:integrase
MNRAKRKRGCARKHTPTVAIMNGSAHDSAPRRNDIESLPREGRNPDVPIPELGFQAAAEQSPAATEPRIAPAVACSSDNETMSLRTNVLNVSFETELRDLRSAPSELVPEGDSVRFRPVANSTSTIAVPLCLDVQSTDESRAARWAEELREATEHTVEAIGYYRDWRGTMQKRSERTLDKGDYLLGRLFREPLIKDPILGHWRPPVLHELLRPDSGRLMILQIARGLEDLAPDTNLAYDLLAAFRVFARFVSGDAAVLPSGVDLRKHYGALVCPLGDRDLKRPTPKSTVFLPPYESMPLIHDAIYDWAASRRNKWTAWRTATAVTLCFESGLRGIEARRLSFEDQAGGDVFNPLAVRSAKDTPPREVIVDPWGWELLTHWLREWRPERAPANEGCFFSSSTSAGTLASSSLSETSKALLDHLKATRGPGGAPLLHESFTFHATRKTYATHYLQKNGTDVDPLLTQCGWASAVQLGTYVKPSAEVIRNQGDQFARSVGMRRAG